MCIFLRIPLSVEMYRWGREGSWIGAGTTIIPGVKIGKWSVIGAGSVVTKDIPDHVLAVGNRCKIIKSI